MFDNNSWRGQNEYYSLLNGRLFAYFVEIVVGESSGVIAVQNWFMGKFFKREFAEIKQTSDLLACPIQNPMTSRFVPILEQLKYKYLISVDAYNTYFSWQLPWILLSDSVLLMVESTHKEWFFDDLKPWVHYVPIKDDFSDIFSQINYLRKNDEKARNIAINGQNFARFHF